MNREVEAEIACALEGLAWVGGVYRLDPSELARASRDEYRLAIQLVPYDIDRLVKTHYAVLVATGDQETTGRVLYVNGATLASPTPMRRATKIDPTFEEKRAAKERIATRIEEAARREAAGAYVVRAKDLELAFKRLADVEESASKSGAFAGSPYRDGTAIAAPLTSGGILEIVPDPFPSSSKKRILLVDDDPTSKSALAKLSDVEVTYVEDGWTAIDELAKRTFDLVLCATVVGDFPGVKLFRIAAKERPELASRFVFVAGASAVAAAPPDSARGRVVARPIDPAAVTALLDRR